MIVEMLDFLNLPSGVKPEVHCSVFEDNQSAYLLATNQKLSVRTKYFCVKHHFFWSHVFHEERNPDGYLVIFQCDTTLQNADYLTKGLVRALYDPNRKRLQGWWHAVKLVNTLLRVYNDCIEESKSIQYMKGMYRTRVRSLLIHPCSFQSQTPWESIRKNSKYRGSQNRKNSEFARPFCVNTLTRDIARSFSQVFTITVPERTQILHEFYRNSVSFYYSFCYLHYSNYFRSYTN